MTAPLYRDHTGPRTPEHAVLPLGEDGVAMLTLSPIDGPVRVREDLPTEWASCGSVVGTVQPTLRYDDEIIPCEPVDLTFAGTGPWWLRGLCGVNLPASHRIRQELQGWVTEQQFGDARYVGLRVEIVQGRLKIEAAAREGMSTRAAYLGTFDVSL